MLLAPIAVPLDQVLCSMLSPPIDWDYTFRPDPIEGLTKAPHALTVASDPSLKLKGISIADCKIRSSQPGKYITNIYVYLFRMDKCICILST